MNPVVNPVVISADIVSGIFMVFIALEVGSRKLDAEPLRVRWFFYFVLAEVFGVLIDAASFASPALTDSVPIILGLNLVAYIWICFGFALFCLYQAEVIREVKKISYTSVWLVAAGALVNAIWVIAGIVTEKLFYVENGALIYGPWEKYIGIIPTICVVIVGVVLLHNRKDLDRRRFYSLSSFIFIPVLAALLSLVYPESQLAYVGGAFACQIIYIFIQDEAVNEAQISADIMGKLSTLDTLSGLRNRRGYEEVLEALGAGGDSAKIGVFFCDLNELKYMNDNYGHAAGDAYIVRFAKMLKTTFEDFGEICRISGDEFVVLCHDTDRVTMAELAEKFRKEIAENDSIASFGYVYGEGRAPLDLVSEAEKAMYLDKARYYSENGRDRRK